MRPVYNNENPEGWNELELKRAALFKRGYTWEKEQETERESANTIPVIRIPNIKDNLDLENLLHLHDVTDNAKEAAAVEKGWILFVGSNGNPSRIGDSALLEEDAEMVFASFLIGMTSREPENLSPEFLALWMRLHNVHETFSRTSQQTTGLANYSWGAVKKLPVRFPKNSKEQVAIVSAIYAADDALQKTKTELETTHRLKNALMQQLFTRGMPGRHDEYKTVEIPGVSEQQKQIEIPVTWNLERVADLLTDMDAGSSPQCESEPAKPGEWGVVKVSVVSWDEFDEHENKALPPDIDPDLDAEIHVGDIIVSRANTTELTGAVQRVRQLYSRLLLCDKTWRLHPKEEIEPEWLVLSLKQKLVRRQIHARATGTSDSMKNIAKRDFRNLLVPKPPQEEQAELANTIETCDNQISALKDKIDRLGKLKTSLLQNLLTGKLRIKAEP